MTRAPSHSQLFHAMGTSWSPSSDIFPTSPSTRARASSMLPFQAAACWNGIALLRTSSLLPITDANPPHAFFPTIDTSATHFRRSRPEEGECAQAEVSLICKDLWRKGRGRILVVPGVRLAYERHVAVNSRDAVGASGVAYGTSAWGLQEQVAWLPQYVLEAFDLLRLLSLTSLASSQGRRPRSGVTPGLSRSA